MKNKKELVRVIRTPEDRGELTLEEIMVRTERRTFHV